MGIEGLLAALVLLALPFAILAALVQLLPTKRLEYHPAIADEPAPLVGPAGPAALPRVGG